MKTKVHGDKDKINIDINIENNLMSKNPYKTTEDKMATQATQRQQQTKLTPNHYQYNPELPKLVNEYLGIMAYKNLFNTNDFQQPRDLGTHLTNLTHAPSTVAAAPTPPTVAPAPTTPVAHAAPSTVAPAPTTPIASPPPSPHPSMGFPATGLTGMPSMGGSHMPSMGGAGILSPIPTGMLSPINSASGGDGDTEAFAGLPDLTIPQHDNTLDVSGVAVAGDAEEDDIGEYDEHNLTISHGLGDVAMERDVEVLTDDQETFYVASLKPGAVSQRQKLIDRIEDPNDLYKPQKSSIISKKLGKHIKKYKPQLWERLMNGTY
jgi:hypothetical protein